MPSLNPAILVRLTALGMLGGMALSPALWGFGYRGGVPLLPVWGQASAVDAAPWLGFLLVAALLGALIQPNLRLWRWAVIVMIGLLCALDLLRLQPWVWCYVLLFVMSFMPQPWQHTRWLLGGMYAWSGWHKLTPYFAEDNLSWFCSAFEVLQPVGNMPMVGYTMAAIELLLGVALCMPRSQKLAVYGLWTMHAVILVLLVKLDWNRVVIPWNVCLAALLWQLHREPESAVPSRRLPWAALVAAWVLPLFYWVGGWPHTLSWALYSNTQPEATFYAAQNPFPEKTTLHGVWVQFAFEDGKRLLFDDWTAAALQVPLFDSDHTFRQLGQYLCAQHTLGDTTLELSVLKANPWNKSDVHIVTCTCQELAAAGK
jgi:hypothetical protein